MQFTQSKFQCSDKLTVSSLGQSRQTHFLIYSPELLVPSTNTHFLTGFLISFISLFNHSKSCITAQPLSALFTRVPLVSRTRDALRYILNEKNHPRFTAKGVLLCDGSNLSLEGSRVQIINSYVLFEYNSYTIFKILTFALFVAKILSFLAPPFFLFLNTFCCVLFHADGKNLGCSERWPLPAPTEARCADSQSNNTWKEQSSSLCRLQLENSSPSTESDLEELGRRSQPRSTGAPETPTVAHFESP